MSFALFFIIRGFSHGALSGTCIFARLLLLLVLCLLLLLETGLSVYCSGLDTLYFYGITQRLRHDRIEG